jgi:2-oxoglutarate ferredoxin oxidoreductase subunit delta
VVKVVVKEELCKGCELCVNACPKGALALGDKPNANGYYTVQLVQPEKCNSCTLCAIMCPDVALEIYK